MELYSLDALRPFALGSNIFSVPYGGLLELDLAFKPKLYVPLACAGGLIALMLSILSLVIFFSGNFVDLGVFGDRESVRAPPVGDFNFGDLCCTLFLFHISLALFVTLYGCFSITLLLFYLVIYASGVGFRFSSRF